MTDEADQEGTESTEAAANTHDGDAEPVGDPTTATGDTTDGQVTDTGTEPEDSTDTDTMPGEAGGTDGHPGESTDTGTEPEADTDAGPEPGEGSESAGEATETIPADVRSYDKFSKIEGGSYDRANEFLRERTHITAREWAIARLCADFRTETGVEMTKIGENLPHLVPFMTDTYSPQAVNQARASFEEKVRMAGATFLYGAMSDFFTAEELDDVMYEATEVAKFLLEVEGVDLSVEEELAAEERISEVMREVREHSAAIRHDELECPECGHRFEAGEE